MSMQGLNSGALARCRHQSRRLPSAIAALAAVILSWGFPAAQAENLDQLFADYWAHEMRENPLRATGSGVNEYNDRMPDASPGAEARRQITDTEFLVRLDAAAMAGASESERLSAELLRFVLKHRVALAPYREWRMPILSDSGFHTELTYVVDSTPFRTVEDYEAYLSRLRALPRFIEQNIENMRAGLADGFTQPKVILPGILTSFDAQAAGSADESPFYAPFTRIPASIPARTRRRLAQEGKEAIRSEVLRAFARAAAFMRDEYALRARDTIGASALPEGDAYYRALVRYYTTRDDATPEAVHALGLREVARIRAEMNAVIKESGFKGDFAAFQAFLRSDPQFYPKTADELLHYAAWLAKSIDGKLPAFFGKLPRQPYSVEPVPAAIAENYTSGRYSSAPPGASRGGQYWVNTTHLDKRPLYEMPALTLHEATPGHHLQAALAYEIESAPEFRKQFYPHAFGEGWALYAEKLGVEMGVYQTPYDRFGRLSFEMWRAARLVIDTGIHSKGWSRAQAIDYLASNTALSSKNVETEVDRYISWPGQALAYKMGELTILELRARAQKALGDRFDIREFHDAVLAEGGLPLDVLAARIDAYIAREKATRP
jgi:uncharacterized protein (DUF885 family)